MARKGAVVAEWRDRTVAQAHVAPSELVKHPQNWRAHPQHQQAAMVGVLEDIGWIQDVIVNQRTGFLIDGHLRVALALKRKESTVPVKYVDLSEAEELEALATFDPITALATAEQATLKAVLEQVQSDEAGVQALLASLAEQEGIVLAGLDEEPLEDPGPAIDRAEELREQWGVELGQVWELGEHRVVCGDCRNKKVVNAVMSGEQACLGVTSPPYSIRKEYEKDVSFAEHLALLRSVADSALSIIAPGKFWFVNFDEISAQSHAGSLTGSSRQCIYPISMNYWEICHIERKMDLYAQRIWYKPFRMLSQPFWTYHTSIPHHQEWEHIWTWRLPGGSVDEVYDWDISCRAIWDTREESTNPDTPHMAAFPVGIPERAIKAHSAKLDIVWDPFLGSGTTLIACERLHRKCRGIEIAPGYVAVTLQRWAEMTGKTPVLSFSDIATNVT